MRKRNPTKGSLLVTTPSYQLDMANTNPLFRLNTEPRVCDKEPCYEMFRRFVRGMAVVTDAAER